MLRAQNLQHFYGNDKVLKDVDLEVKKASFTALVGESGSGKTTLLCALSSLLKPSSGKVFFNNVCLHDLKDINHFRRQEIGFVFQFHHLIAYLSLEENVRLANEEVSHQELDTLFKRLGILHLKKRLPHEVSGGERQRTALVRALVNKPQILFADEPTGNLDSQNSQKVFELFLELAKEGTTVVVATHDKNLASLADTILEVRDGQIL